MNRLVIIGNGFDLAHGLKTSYMDFINWYWEQRLCTFINNLTSISEDKLCSMIIKNEEMRSWSCFYSSCCRKHPITKERQFTLQEIIDGIREDKENFSFKCSPFFDSILKSIETKGWVDIENDYYRCLKKAMNNSQCGYTIQELNEQLYSLQTKLVEYLNTIDKNAFNKNLHDKMIELFDPKDFSQEGKQKAYKSIGYYFEDIQEISNPETLKKYIPQSIMLLSFNYTETAKHYGNFNLTHNYIHGELSREKEIIFGYGDELDKDYKELLDMNDNELLKFAKNVKYLETSHYRKMLNFINAGPFQVFIMGHSCGNSDRTLLNTVFEHENCVSIKPFYYKKANGADNYLELVQNISRNFTDMKLFRDRVVNKEQCLSM